MNRKSKVSPFLKQCFVTAGASLGIMSTGFCLGFTSILLLQLKETKYIDVSDDQASWIASILSIGGLFGIIIVSYLMDHFGRRNTFLLDTVIMTVGWICLSISINYSMLIFARLLQGVSIGITSILTPVLIGEYTSPKNRGSFLATISFSLFTGSLTTHSLGLLLTWPRTALVCTLVSFINTVIIILSPESPSFLAVHGKYEKCKKSFHWLRGFDEEEELEKIIQNAVAAKEARNQNKKAITLTRKAKGNIFCIIETMKRKEFHKPLFLMLHLYILNEWGGAIIQDIYAVDVVQKIVGKDANLFVIIQSVDIQKIISSILAIYIMRKLKRRTILILAGSLNIFIYFVIVGYTYCKCHLLLPWDHQSIGVLLIHLHMFSVSVGNSPLSNTLSGELFSLKFKGISSLLASIFYTCIMFVNIKFFPHLSSKFGIHVAYFVFACTVLYAFIVLLFFLPETKDKTLQDIEDEFKSQGSLDKENIKSYQTKELISNHRTYIPAYLETDDL